MFTLFNMTCLCVGMGDLVPAQNNTEYYICVRVGRSDRVLALNIDMFVYRKG